MNLSPGFLIALCLLLVSCDAPAREYSTWASLGDKPTPVRIQPKRIKLPENAFPWAGTVSHHLLADVFIEQWFIALSRQRSVDVFYILSPSHWGLSVQPFSLTDGSWRTDAGLVRSDRKQAHVLAQRLGVSFEPAAFEPEHGVSTLMPYIKRHFPQAHVVAVLYRGEPPVNMQIAGRLRDALVPEFDATGKKQNFLIISTDFSHHGTLQQTVAKDKRTRLFFDKPSIQTWIFAGCDNRPGIFTLASFLDANSRCTILNATNSYELSGQEPQDITSYFFTLLWDIRS